ncbi:LCP family protein [Leucobacter rhizosphaerae]|uniref:LCP family protein n=1 Tax=Leucobacter rhizosphaerae TaxID=2932245 RepID=A0ABY4FUG8_9MICO|nr:LCP family protein [Leucobacter rhizosphaerae]UOQ59910.1 LCP family protein [Leucobacter rhizosphaerae]
MATNGGAGTSASNPRHGRLRRSNSWANIGRLLLTTAIVVVLSGIATVSYSLLGLFNDVKTVELGGAGDVAQAVGLGSSSIEGELTVLLVGTDSRVGQTLDDGEEGELNDVNLLLHVSADHQRATVVSFPRDLMVPVPSCPGPNGEPNYYSAMSEQQLNSTLGVGGLPCVVATISELTGMDIPYAGMITFDGVIGVSNALGGIDVCLAQPIYDEYTGLDLPAGVNNLVGGEALQFLRTRHGVGDGGDTSRISNQQVFMSALVRELKSADTLSDPAKVYGLAKAGIENMTLSSNMATMSFMQQVAGTVKDIDLESINFVQYPSATHPYEAGRLTPDRVAAQTLFDVLKSGQAFDVTAVGEGVADTTAEVPVDPATDPNAVVDPNAPVDPNAEVDPNAVADPNAPATTDPTVDPNAPVQLPSTITGQRADTQTCSQGRTVF